MFLITILFNRYESFLDTIFIVLITSLLIVTLSFMPFSLYRQFFIMLVFSFSLFASLLLYFFVWANGKWRSTSPYFSNLSSLPHKHTIPFMSHSSLHTFLPSAFPTSRVHTLTHTHIYFSLIISIYGPHSTIPKIKNL